MAASSPSSSASSVAGKLESTTDKILDGEIDTTDTKARYLALLGRARPVLLPAARYLAYTRYLFGCLGLISLRMGLH